MPESVLVVPNSILEPYIPGPDPMLITSRAMDIYSLVLDNHIFLERSLAEEDYTHKQAIPYVAVRHGNNYLMLKRTSKQTEKRLHDKLSLGIGGHINPGENSQEDIILSALHRELEEEVHIARPKGLNFRGIINDESNNVSKVHLGLLFILDSSDGVFEVREKELMTAEWVNKDALGNHYEGFETWSQIVLDSYINKEETTDLAGENI